jgi:hypothetical protein
MSKFLKTLAKMGLVELDAQELPAGGEQELSDADVQRILAEARGESAPAPSPAAPSTPAPASAPVSRDVVEGRAFEELYREAGLTSPAFPAERLLKLLDGLRAMDAGTRKAAVLAMDAADEAWTIEDPLLDAAKKMQALGRAKTGLDASVQAAEARCREELAARDKYLADATTTIREQIAQLEKTLQDEIGNVAREKAELEAGLRATREAAARESARVDQELRRLEEIPAIFGAAPPPPAGRR